MPSAARRPRRRAAERATCCSGRSTRWLIWHLTGGLDGGVHVTDVTNASRTMLMDLATLAWDPELLAEIDIPAAMLPEIRSSSEVYGSGVGDLAGVPIAGDLGDQHAALFGQACFEPGQMKCTYGTGCFMLMHTGERPVASGHGLITTVAARIGDAPATYALEGSVAVTGSLIGWLRDNLGIIGDASEVEALARSVPGQRRRRRSCRRSRGCSRRTGGATPEGSIAGLTAFATRGHIARAALEATAYQVNDLCEAMAADLGAALPGELRVDGGMIRNDLLMQFQADILGRPVVAPPIAETTALGAAYAAGLAVGFWGGLDELRAMDRADRRWEPSMDATTRAAGIARWQRGSSAASVGSIRPPLQRPVTARRFAASRRRMAEIAGCGLGSAQHRRPAARGDLAGPPGSGDGGPTRWRILPADRPSPSRSSCGILGPRRAAPRRSRRRGPSSGPRSAC